MRGKVGYFVMMHYGYIASMSCGHVINYAWPKTKRLLPILPGVLHKVLEK